MVKTMVFPIVICIPGNVMSWTIKKAEHQRVDVFKLWCWRRLFRVPWTARRSSQSILKEINSWVFIRRTDAEAEAPILWPLDTKNQLIGKDPDAGKDWGQEEKGETEDEMVDSITDSADIVWANDFVISSLWVNMWTATIDQNSQLGIFMSVD